MVRRRAGSGCRGRSPTERTTGAAYAPSSVAILARHECKLIMADGDVIEEEASRKESLSGLPMYGDDFPEER